MQKVKKIVTPFIDLLRAIILIPGLVWTAMPVFAAEPPPRSIESNLVDNHLTTAAVLLVNTPTLWSGPSRESETRATAWKAGCRLEVRSVRGSLADWMTTETTWIEVASSPAEASSGFLPHAYLSVNPASVAPDEFERVGLETVDRRHALGPDYVPPDLVEIEHGYSDDVNYRLRRQAAAAAESMIDAAAAEGIMLYVVSAYRSWDTQQRIYERKLRRSGWNQTTVAKPGHSEHQLGTTIDLTDGDLETLLKPEFGETRAGEWLRKNAWMYGFAQSYTAHNQEKTGYSPEPWHYRYWGVNQAHERHREALGGLGEEDGFK